MTFTSLTFDQEISDAPEWVHLLPLGRTVARDGRQFVLDNPDAVIAHFQAGGVDLPIDYEHQLGNGKNATGPVPAAGWIKELACRADGIWGRVEWTARARDLITTKEYRYLSPVIMVRNGDGTVAHLTSAGLVHNPALRLTPLAASLEEQEAAEQHFTARIARLLNLPSTASEAEISAALSALVRDGARPDPRRFVPIEAMEAALQEHGARRQERVVQKVEEAFRNGYLTTPMKAWAFDLCATDEAAFDRFLATAVPAFAHLTHVSHTKGVPGEADGGRPTAPEAASVARQLGLAEDALKD